MNQPEGTGIEYQKNVVVDGRTYKLHVFMPSRAFKLGARVAKFLGEPAVAMASAGGDEGKVADSLSAAVKALMANLHEDEVWAVIVELMSSVTCEGKSVNIDLHFKGQLGSLLKLTSEILKFQFSDFLTAIGQAVADVSEKARK